MSTGNSNLDLLVKLLSTATHPTTPDPVALIAMRKAGEQLAKFNTDWTGLLKGRVTVVADPFTTAAAAPQFTPKAAPRASAPPPPPPPPKPAPPARPSATALRHVYSLGQNAAEHGKPSSTNPYDISFSSELHSEWNRGFQSVANKAKPKPMPKDPLGMGSSQPAPDPNQGRPNKFPGKCYVCSRQVGPGDGTLAGKDSNGHYRVLCGPNFGHNAKYSQRSPRPAAGLDDLADLV